MSPIKRLSEKLYWKTNSCVEIKFTDIRKNTKSKGNFLGLYWRWGWTLLKKDIVVPYHKKWITFFFNHRAIKISIFFFLVNKSYIFSFRGARTSYGATVNCKHLSFLRMCWVLGIFFVKALKHTKSFKCSKFPFWLLLPWHSVNDAYSRIGCGIIFNVSRTYYGPHY